MIRHVLMFENAIKSFSFRNKWSKSNFSRVLFDFVRERIGENWQNWLARRETWSFGRTPEMVPEVLQLRGGTGGDEEK